MKIGLLFGCFDPIHKDHLNMAKMLVEDGFVDKVIVIPAKTNLNVKDSPIISGRYRYEMIKIASKDLNAIEVTDLEMKKEKQNYTYSTVMELREIYPNDELYLIIGDDNLKNLYWWKNVDVLLNSVKVIAMNRDEKNIEDIIDHDAFLKKYKDRFIAISFYKNNLVSSALVRKRLKHRESVEDLIDKGVLDYIIKNNLYKGDDNEENGC